MIYTPEQIEKAVDALRRHGDFWMRQYSDAERRRWVLVVIKALNMAAER